MKKWEGHYPVNREGNVRILKNKFQQAKVVGISKRNWFNRRIFRQKTLDDLNQEIQSLLNQKSKGFNKVSLEFILVNIKILEN